MAVPQIIPIQRTQELVTAKARVRDLAHLVWQTFPEVPQAAGVSWKVYQDLAGQTLSPDFGDGTRNFFAGNFTDNSLLYFKQYAAAAPNSPLFQYGATGTEIVNIIPTGSAPAAPGRIGQSTCSTTSEVTCRAESCRRFPGS